MKNIKTTNKNILYILGAGASAGALPVVNEMVSRMKIIYMSRLITDDKELFDLVKGSVIRLYKIIPELEKRRSFDTFAKEIYLQINDNSNKDIGGYKQEYKNLKEILKSYLTIEEQKQSVDKDIRLKLIKIISNHNPNYNFNNDTQILDNLNKSYKVNNNIDEILQNWINLVYNGMVNTINSNVTDYPEVIEIIKSGIKELFRFAPNKDNPEKIYFVNDKSDIDQRYINFLVDILDGDLDKIKIYSWNYDSQFKKASEYLGFDKLDIKINKTKKLLENEIKINGSIEESEIQFAWEHEKDFTFLKLEENKEWFKNVTDIVIIGYSFPFSNRRTDLKILNSVIWMFPKKYNIYIQTLDEESFNNIKESVESLINEITQSARNNYNYDWEKYIKIIPKYDKTSFFIPPHY